LANPSGTSRRRRLFSGSRRSSSSEQLRPSGAQMAAGASRDAPARSPDCPLEAWTTEVRVVADSDHARFVEGESCSWSARRDERFVGDRDKQTRASRYFLFGDVFLLWPGIACGAFSTLAGHFLIAAAGSQRLVRRKACRLASPSSPPRASSSACGTGPGSRARSGRPGGHAHPSRRGGCPVIAKMATAASSSGIGGAGR
jgi:hypothetical protein